MPAPHCFLSAVVEHLEGLQLLEITVVLQTVVGVFHIVAVKFVVRSPQHVSQIPLLTLLSIQKLVSFLSHH